MNAVAFRSGARSLRVTRLTQQRQVPSWSLLRPRTCNNTHSQVAKCCYNTESARGVAAGSRAIPVHLSIPARRQQPTTLAEWLWNQVNVPKGFENFFPKGGAGKHRQSKPPTKGNGEKNGAKKETKNSDDKKTGSSSKAGEKTRTTTNEKKTSSSSRGSGRKNRRKKMGMGGVFQKSGGGAGGKNDQPGPENPWVVGIGTAMLLALALDSFYKEPDGREVTWAEFHNYMLEPGDVDRIVVVNKRVARVYLRPGARGVPANNTSSRSIRQQQAYGGADAEWKEQTVMDIGGAQSSLEDSTIGASSSISVPSHSNQQQLVYHFNIGSIESFEDKLARAQQDLGYPARDYVPVQYAQEVNVTTEALKLLPTLATFGLIYFVFSRFSGAAGGARGGGMGGIFQIGKSNAKKINKEDISVSFKDVAGCQEAKKEIMEFVDFLQDSSRFTKLGAKIPKGALLCGPPGTGKTLLAKAVAGEANVPFYSISGSDFIEMFVGVGPSRVRDLFKEARSNAPCIVFIDEIDAVGRQRGRGGFSGGNDERENTLNQLLVEMDGFTTTTGVVVLAGTNRVDILDQALTRPGRFDRQITVDKPDLQGRKEIFQVHLKGITLEGDNDDIAGRLAGLTPGFAGADIANICNEAAIVAARRKADTVAMEDFEKAADRIIGGLESNKIMSKEERSIVAHHEAGHAVAGWFLEHADPLLKVTIIPRSSGALGYAQYLPKEVFLRTEDQIMDIVCMALAGRAAEEIFFGRVTTGASDDLKRVTQLVYSTIQVYGMNSRVGQLAFPKDPNAMPGDKPYSDATAEAMDEEARQIVDQAYQRTLDLLTEKKSEVEKVAQMLLDKETITHDDIIDSIGPRPFQGDSAYNEFVTQRHSANKKEETPEEEAEAEEQSNEEAPVERGGFTPGLACRGR